MVINWLKLDKEISTLVTLLSLNDKAAREPAVNVILPMFIKPTNATINVKWIFSLPPYDGFMTDKFEEGFLRNWKANGFDIENGQFVTFHEKAELQLFEQL